MKALQKNSIALALLTAYINIMLLYSSSNDLQKLLTTVFILSISLSFLVFGYTLKNPKTLGGILLGLLISLLSLGLHTFVIDLPLIIALRILNGIGLSLAILSSSLCLHGLYKDTDIVINSAYRVASLIILSTIILLPIKSFISNVLHFNWIYLLAFFLTVFAISFMAFTSSFVPFKFKAIQNGYNQNLSSILYGGIGIITASLSLGILLYHVLSNDIKISYFSSSYLINTFLISILLAFITPIKYLWKRIGFTKAICCNMLLLALNISAIPLLYKTPLIVLSIALCAFSIGVILATAGSFIIKPHHQISIPLGIFYCLLLMGFTTGYYLAYYIQMDKYSPLIFASIIVISGSIYYIRRIHQTETLKL